jgi:hypothetical protein
MRGPLIATILKLNEEGEETIELGSKLMFMTIFSLFIEEL